MTEATAIKPKIFKIFVERFLYTTQTTIGRMYFLYDDKEEYFGYTLEDTVRPRNIKVRDYTAILEGIYNVSVRKSPKFGETVIFYTEDDKVTIKRGELKWDYCLAHGGNTHADTSGCVLVAKNKVNLTTIQGSLKDELVLRVKEMIGKGYIISAEFLNLTQKN